MLILGVDPGLRQTGYGGLALRDREVRLIEAGIIRSNAKTPLCDRLCELSRGLLEVIESIKPEIMVVESLYSHYQHPPTAILMGHARGVLIAAAAERGIPVVDYSATRIKKSLTGNGRASKLQMQRTILAVLNLARLPDPPDVADALAVALCHANVISRDEWSSR